MSNPYPRSILCFLLALTLASISNTAAVVAQERFSVEKYRAAAISRWEEAMVDFDKRNAAETHPENSILFIGSSSIRRWEDITADLAPYHPIQRGFGGSRWSDVAVFAERLISPHRFRAVVFFVGNDITGGENDKSPTEVTALFAYVRAAVRKHNPNAPVFYVAVTPTERRWAAWPQIKAANTAVRALCQLTPNTHFIGTESIFLNAEGQPRSELFVADKLHLNREGYIRWTAAIKAHLDTVLDGAR